MPYINQPARSRRRSDLSLLHGGDLDEVSLGAHHCFAEGAACVVWVVEVSRRDTTWSLERPQVEPASLGSEAVTSRRSVLHPVATTTHKKDGCHWGSSQRLEAGPKHLLLQWWFNGIWRRTMVISWDLTKKKCDLMGFDQQQWWFHGIWPRTLVISWDFRHNNGDLMGFYPQQWWFNGIWQRTMGYNSDTLMGKIFF